MVSANKPGVYVISTINGNKVTYPVRMKPDDENFYFLDVCASNAERKIKIPSENFIKDIGDGTYKAFANDFNIIRNCWISDEDSLFGVAMRVALYCGDYDSKITAKIEANKDGSFAANKVEVRFVSAQNVAHSIIVGAKYDASAAREIMINTMHKFATGIRNPVVAFTNTAKGGKLNDLSDEEYAMLFKYVRDVAQAWNGNDKSSVPRLAFEFGARLLLVDDDVNIWSDLLKKMYEFNSCVYRVNHSDEKKS